MHYLRQSTASQEILLGPFVDSTDGSTAETALTINASDIKIWKHGGTTEANKNSGGATHIAAGRYYAVLDATDTDTVGMLEINVSVSGALPVRRPYMVLEEAIYDMLFASSANGDSAGVTAIKTVTDRLDTALELDGAVYRFTANALEQAPSSGLDAAGVRSAVGLASANLDVQLSGIQSGVTSILAFNGSTFTSIPWNPAWDAEVQSECADALVVYAPLTTLGANAPANWINAASIAASALNYKGNWNVGKTGYSLSSTQSFNLTGNITGNLSGSVGSVTTTVSVSSASINSIADQVWDEAYNQHTTVGTFGKLMDILRKSNYVTDGTVIAGSTPTTTTFRTDLTQPDDTYDHQTLLFLNGNLEGESKPILTYTQANGVIVLDEALTEAPQIGDEFVILPIHVHPISIMTTAFQAGLATSAAQVTAQADLDILTGTDGATISTDSITAIFSHLIESGVTFKQLLRAVAAIQVGEISNAGQSTETYKAIGNEDTTRVSAEVDEDGNRNNITLTL